jgi:hypothetical protein
LTFHQHYRQVAFISGLYYDDATATVVVSYGSGDWESRVLLLEVEEVEQMLLAGPNPAH